jgi:hypothetical protein
MSIENFLNEGLKGSHNEIRQLLNKGNIDAMLSHLNDIDISSLVASYHELRDFLIKLQDNVDTIALHIGDRLK